MFNRSSLRKRRDGEQWPIRTTMNFASWQRAVSMFVVAKKIIKRPIIDFVLSHRSLRQRFLGMSCGT
jgi:hypothetical protein